MQFAKTIKTGVKAKLFLTEMAFGTAKISYDNTLATVEFGQANNLSCTTTTDGTTTTLEAEVSYDYYDDETGFPIDLEIKPVAGKKVKGFKIKNIETCCKMKLN